VPGATDEGLGAIGAAGGAAGGSETGHLLWAKRIWMCGFDGCRWLG
jgi:hypothetical protein